MLLNYSASLSPVSWLEVMLPTAFKGTARRYRPSDYYQGITSTDKQRRCNFICVVFYYNQIWGRDKTLSFSAESVSATVTFPVKVTTVFLGSSATFGQKRCDTSAGCSEVFVSSCSGSEWQSDRRMDPDEVMYLYVITMIGPEPRCL